ncbi:outer membrane protein assembly factor BamB family protein [Palleronia abyssalis]|uniref:Outer membrane protein assembly factor BamB n=1 Tax=Palleronia abyssalis TaxID=1501240 RepID=A0A2R8BUF5_9RHOB|nr:PQQ-like beta-propeller repeat protein [Palleronia abyssalis]SPJ23763.1 Outer membrane protein assembly factor BamB [Palleronia abyssalis]
MVRIGLATVATLALLAGCGDREELLLGERMNLRAEDTVNVDRALPLSLPAPVAIADWTHTAYAPDHDIPHGALSANPGLRFSVDIGQAEDRRHRITASPVVASDRIFTVDSRARVMAHTISGQPIWSTDVSPVGETTEASGAGLAVSGGTLFVSTAYGQLLALDTGTGRQLWVQDLGAAASGPPTVSDGTVYVVGRDSTAWAINAENGRILWSEQGTPSSASVVGGAAPAVANGTIVFPFDSRELRGVLPGGTPIWTSALAGSRAGRVYASITDISADPVIAGDTVYAGSPSGRTNAYTLSSGTLIWSAEEGAMSPVVVTGGSVFAVTDQAELVRLNANDGSRVWGVSLPYFERTGIRRRKSVFTHNGPVLAGGRLWVASSDEKLRAFDPETGAQRGEIALPGGAASDPVVAGQTLYVVSRDGQLLAFR